MPPSVGRKVVETVDMIQTVSLQLPVDGNSILQVSSGPSWKISRISSWFDPENPLMDVRNDSGRVTLVSVDGAG